MIETTLEILFWCVLSIIPSGEIVCECVTRPHLTAPPATVQITPPRNKLAPPTRGRAAE